MFNKRYCEEEAAIKKIECLVCRQNLELIREIKDVNNSDFYSSTYKCENCEYSIEIITQEVRD